MKQLQTTLRRPAIVQFLIALIVGVLVAEAVISIGGNHTVTLQFANANGLVAGNAVTLDGNTVGTVEFVAVGASPGSSTQMADVSVTLQSGVWPLHQGTQFSIRPHGVLGNMYVEFDPGPVANPTLPASHTFGLSETSSPVNLDELTNVFTSSVRSAIQTQLQQGTIMFGNGGAEDLNQTLVNSNPLLASAVPVTNVLATHSAQLDHLNSEFDTISTELAEENGNLRGLINSADTTLAAIATQQQQVEATLDGAAGTFTTLDKSLSGEQQNLENFFRSGPAVLNQTEQLTQTLVPLIANLNPHIPSLDTLLQEFVSATGYNTGTGGIDTLRIDPTLPPVGDSSSECGGQPAQQGGVC